jgi:hypothetical protein
MVGERMTANPIRNQKKETSSMELTESGRDLVVAAIPLLEGVDDTFFGGKGEPRNALNRELRRLILNR